MATEIERKFLVSCPDKVTQSWRPHRDIVQCYTTAADDACSRIRASSITTRGITIHSFTTTHKIRKTDMTRTELEHDVSMYIALQQFRQSPNPLIYKTRYLVPYNDSLQWEIDVFHADNHGLIVAEIELPHESYQLTIPSWIGDEVTNDMKYTNVQLSGNPFCNWE